MFDKFLTAAKTLTPSQVVTFVLFFVLAVLAREVELNRAQYATDRDKWSHHMDHLDERNRELGQQIAKDASSATIAQQQLVNDVRSLTRSVEQNQALILDHLLQVKREQRELKGRIQMSVETPPIPHSDGGCW